MPPLEKSKDTGEFVPLWKQEVSEMGPKTFAKADFAFRCAMRKADGDCMVLLLEASQLGTSTQWGLRKVRVFYQRRAAEILIALLRMGAFCFHVFTVGSCEGKASTT